MKKIIEVANSDKCLDRLMQSEFFTCKETDNGIRVSYHGTAGAIAPPIIKLKKINDTQLSATILTNTFLLIVTLLITAFFWIIAYLAYTKENPSLAGIIISLFSPSIMWLLDIFVTNKMARLIIDEIISI